MESIKYMIVRLQCRNTWRDADLYRKLAAVGNLSTTLDIISGLETSEI